MFLIDNTSMKERKAITKREKMTNTIGEIKTRKTKVTNLSALVKKRLILNLRVMMNNFSMSL